jgi:glycyl-tRNA synthetase beta chain
MSDFLLEIGCENLPASYVLPALRQLAADAEALFGELRLRHEGIYTTGTPRRLVLAVSNLAGIQETKTETITGPPVSRACDGDGKPTKAAEGFARSLGVAVSKLQTVATKKGDYLGITRKLKNRKTAPLMREHLPGLIAGLKFPKTMRWEAQGVRFARPIRWMVAMHGDSAITVRFAGVVSGKASYTVPWIDKKKIRIAAAASYGAILNKQGVIVDHHDRRAALEKLAQDASRSAGYRLIEDPALFDELTFMVEEPYVFIGEFPARYLELPPEVVITAMKAHQRYFALQDDNGTLVPRFLAFIDGKKASPERIRAGNEKVLRARLADALFYWQEDLKKGISGLAEKLDSIVFIEGLGTIKDKSKRLHGMIEFIDSLQTEPRAGDDTLERIAKFAKADLASEMVKDGKEFTLLEGLMGSHYARAAGENAEIVSAIREHYLPRTLSDPLPTNRAATYLSIADKIDSICGCFLAGLVPTGSQDPYGLRRQTIGLIRILEKYPLLSFSQLIDRAIALYREAGIPGQADYEAAQAKIERFIRNRLEVFIKERGIEYDVVAAAARVAWTDPALCLKRCAAIQAIKKREAFELLITGVKRVGNILSENSKLFGIAMQEIELAFSSRRSSISDIPFSPDLFEDPVESELMGAARERIPLLTDSEKRDDFDAILSILAELGPPIDRYFDTVLVNCDQEAIRNNRVTFLAALFALFSRYADFSCIVEGE